MYVTLNKNKTNNNVSFKAPSDAVTQGLYYLSSYPAVGAVVIDTVSMGIPRTLVDSTRGKDAATETAIREFGSTLNFAIFGIWGMLAAAVCGKSISNKFKGIRADKIFADGDTIQTFSNIYNDAKVNRFTKENKTRAFVASVFDNFSALNGSEWKSLDEKQKGEIVKILSDEIISGKSKNCTIDKVTKSKLASMITAATGGNQNCRIIYGQNKIENMSANLMLDHIMSIGRSYMQYGKEKLPQEVVKSLKSNKVAASLAGLAIPVTIGLSMQPINRFLTKLRTGKEGFVGVQGEQADNSKYFGLTKMACAVGIGGVLLSTIGSFSNILNKVQFSGIIPTFNQFKLVYGLTIASRIMSARDKNELRETCIKDPLGFANWLILGGFVTKLIARGMDKDLINYDKTTCKSKSSLGKAWHWVTNASVKNSEEVLLSALKKENKLDMSATKTFNQLLKDLPESMKSTRVKIRNVNIAQLAGYLYSAMALGVGIPYLNIYLTNKYRKQKKTNIVQNTPQNIAVVNSKPVNRLNPYFLGKVSTTDLNAKSK